MVRSANSTMQVWSSMTTTPPEPSIEPALPTWSKSMPMSISSGSKTGVDEPPGTTAFNPPPAINPPRHFVDHLFEVVAHRQFVDAGALDVAADPKQSSPAVAHRAH